jgi:hypothetical protein
MIATNKMVFLLDVDNTLIDNDGIATDLSEHLAREFGDACRDRYWEIFEALRVELGYADYLGALQRCRVDTANDPRLLMISSFLVDYPFAKRLYPGGARCHRPSASLGADGDSVGRRRGVPAA